jgi:uncharacterized protein YqeY
MVATIRARISHEVENAQRALSDHDPAVRRAGLLRRDTLRMAQNALYLAEKREKCAPCDEQALEVLFREVRQRVELEADFRRDGQREMADREAAEIAVLIEFLPPPLTDEELATLIAAGIAATGATCTRDAHRVMSHLSSDLRGRADLRVAAAAVSTRLSASAPTVRASAEG